MTFKELYLTEKSMTGKFKVWFPKRRPVYMSSLIPAFSFEQAFAAYIVSDSSNNVWNTDPRGIPEVEYNGRIWKVEEKKFLHKELTKNNDWGGSAEI